MEALEIAGKTYISSKRAAEVTGYTKDYVGQLARGGKIPATRVGRAWYVDEDAIKRHAGVAAPVASDTQSEEAPGAPVEEEEEERGTTRTTVPVQTAPPGAHTLSLSVMRASRTPRRDVLKTWATVRYLPDGRGLFPNVERHESADKEDAVMIRRVESTRVPPHEKRIAHAPHPVFDPTVKKTPLETKTDYVSRHKEIIKNRTKTAKHTSHPLPYVFITASLVLAVVVIWGSLIPSKWAFSYSDTPTIALASVGDAGDPFGLISSYFLTIFDGGINLIGVFLLLLLTSLEQFFQAGLDFILNLV